MFKKIDIYIYYWFYQSGGGVQYQTDPDFVKIIKSKLRPNEDFIDGLVRMGYLDR